MNFPNFKILKLIFMVSLFYKTKSKKEKTKGKKKKKENPVANKKYT